MSLIDVWADKMIPAVVVVVTYTQETSGEHAGETTEVPTDGATIWGIKYNRSEASRYFSREWASDITDVFVTDQNYGIHKNTILKIDSVSWKCDEPQNVAEFSDVYTIGITRNV